MPSPDSALTTLRPDIASSFEEFDTEMDRQGFIGLRVGGPVIECAKPSGTFGKIKLKEILKNRDTLRAPGAPYSRSNWKFEPATFSCEENGAEEPADHREKAMYADFFDAEVHAGRRALYAVLQNHEDRVCAALVDTSVWTGAALTTTVGTAWSTIASAVPVTDVDSARQLMWDGSGIWPNALIMNRTVFHRLRRTTQIIDLCKAQGFMDVRQGEITTDDLAKVFDVEQIIVSGSAKNTADEGQTATIAARWSVGHVMLCRVATTSDPREPCIFRNFHWAEDGSQIGGTVESYEEAQTRSTIIRARHDTDEVVMYAQAGHLIDIVP